MSQRFSDAELAAEYWRSKARASSLEANGYSPHYHLADAETFHRFATLPHAHDPEPRTVFVYDQHGHCIGSYPEPAQVEPKKNIFEITLQGDTR